MCRRDVDRFFDIKEIDICRVMQASGVDVRSSMILLKGGADIGGGGPSTVSVSYVPIGNTPHLLVTLLPHSLCDPASILTSSPLVFASKILVSLVCTLTL